MKLLSPVQIGKKTIKNRVVSTAHSAFLDFFQPGNSGEQYMAYQERRAQGGTGLIILTAMHVHKSSQCNAHYLYEEIDIRNKLKTLADRLHVYGTTVISQLFHFGAQGKSDCRDDLTPLWGFSGRVSQFGEASHAMTEEEIEEVINGFVKAAVIAVESGIDGVELHGTHGYLIQQSFSPWGNQRKDKWGQPLMFISTLARRVREAVGPDAIMGFRISADDFVAVDDGGLRHDGLCNLLTQIVGLGFFDYVNHSEGCGNNHYARAIGTFRRPFGEFLPLTRGLKQAVCESIPVIGVGKIPTPDLAEQALANGDCDLVGMTRAQIADPDLVNKLMQGQANRIRTCTGANQGCIDRTGFYPITCFHNPEVGQEQSLAPLEIVSSAKKVLVIGGGPAGMKAAELACRRGHAVTLVEAGHSLGGRLNCISGFGDATNLLSSIAWLEQELNLLQPNILTQTLVDEAFIKSFEPDEIILATGAVTSVELGVASDGSVPVLSIDDAALGVFDGVKFDMRGASCLFVDLRGNNETTLVLEQLVLRGSQVTYITPFLQFGANLGFTNLEDLLTTLPQRGCRIETSTSIDSIENGAAVIHQVYSGKLERVECDFIVAGSHPKPALELYDIAKRYCSVTMVGDVVAPRSAMEAFREGDRAGRTL